MDVLLKHGRSRQPRSRICPGTCSASDHSMSIGLEPITVREESLPGTTYQPCRQSGRVRTEQFGPGCHMCRMTSLNNDQTVFGPVAKCETTARRKHWPTRSSQGLLSLTSYHAEFDLLDTGQQWKHIFLVPQIHKGSERNKKDRALRAVAHRGYAGARIMLLHPLIVGKGRNSTMDERPSTKTED